MFHRHSCENIMVAGLQKITRKASGRTACTQEWRSSVDDDTRRFCLCLVLYVFLEYTRAANLIESNFLIQLREACLFSLRSSLSSTSEVRSCSQSSSTTVLAPSSFTLHASASTSLAPTPQAPPRWRAGHHLILGGANPEISILVILLHSLL